MLKSNEKITATSGIEWLLRHDPAMRRTGAAIRHVGALARRLASFQDRATGVASFDDEELGLVETVAAQEPQEVEAWRKVEMRVDMEALLCLAREEGTRGLAKRMGCSQRSVQMKLKKLVDAGVEADLFFGENQNA